MTYVLLFVNGNNESDYIQGTLEYINTRFRGLWDSGYIDHDEFEFRSNYQLLGLEEGLLTPLANVTCSTSPQFVVN